MPEEMNGKTPRKHSHQEDAERPFAADGINRHRQRVLSLGVLESYAFKDGEE